MVFLGMRKNREGELDNITNMNMANCLMLLSRTNSNDFLEKAGDVPSRVFECKTCNRQFPSFQALGGHRASHKKPRLTGGESNTENQSPAKPKTHECSICGQEFAIGQALGGHMRRHRAAVQENQAPPPPPPPPPLSLFPTDEEIQEEAKKKAKALSALSLFPTQQLPVLNRSNSKRVLCLDLDLSLNLAPPQSKMAF
ncbi:zinc finger protein ZAT12-like [Cornus florida]|uniref:zinc finger protein ZAT12-like n=1 Tax=Cornus florida TaxID=4283 RepID=UPI00289E7607|nr:zinc finger protein ZAT12-like [Cornus florida]